jgi:hypothetical protein
VGLGIACFLLARWGARHTIAEEDAAAAAEAGEKAGDGAQE